MTVVGGGLTGVETAAELAEQGLPVRLVCNGPPSRRSAIGASLPPPGRSTRSGFGYSRTVAWPLWVRVRSPSSDPVRMRNGPAPPRFRDRFDIPRLAADSGLTTDPDGRLVTDESSPASMIRASWVPEMLWRRRIRRCG